jgi:hypothetical protein
VYYHAIRITFKFCSSDIIVQYNYCDKVRKPRLLKSICASTLKLFLGQVVGARIESEEEEKEATHRQTVKRTDLQAVEGQT